MKTTRFADMEMIFRKNEAKIDTPTKLTFFAVESMQNMIDENYCKAGIIPKSWYFERIQF
jgi:hypothetical protein